MPTKTTKKKTGVVTEPQEKKSEMYSAEAVAAMLKEAAENAVREYASTHPTVRVKEDDTVTLLFIGAIAKDTVVSLGKIGQINRGGGTLDVPKKEFLQNINGAVERMLLSRKLIVVNGLTDEERERYGVKYEDGELLTQNAYYKLLDFDGATLTGLFATLCDSHKITVARMYANAYFELHDNRVNRENVLALAKLAKGTAADGMFNAIIEDYAAKLGEE